MFISIWFFVSGLYPFPYLIAIGTPVNLAIMQPIFIATAIMLIPFIFLMYAWKKKADRT